MFILLVLVQPFYVLFSCCYVLVFQCLVHRRAVCLTDSTLCSSSRSAAHEAVDLESALDDTIVETTWKRRAYPKQILPHVVHSLKAERKLMVRRPQPFVSTWA